MQRNDQRVATSNEKPQIHEDINGWKCTHDMSFSITACDVTHAYEVKANTPIQSA